MEIDTAVPERDEERPDGRRRYHPTDFHSAMWRRLLEHALPRADAFRCALPYAYIRQQVDDAPFWSPMLEPHRAALLERYASHVRWHVLQEQPTEFTVFRVTVGLARTIRGVVDLSHWSWQHRLPEDPTLMADGHAIVTTESREGRITVYADDQELEALRERGVRLIEPLGVQAPPWPTP